MSEHTPGPWRMSTEKGICKETIHRSYDGTMIAEVILTSHRNSDGEANARLIAVAPDLLEAAKVALIVFTSMMEDPNFKPEATRDQIQEAIDKAEAPQAKLEGKS